MLIFFSPHNFSNYCGGLNRNYNLLLGVLIIEALKDNLLSIPPMQSDLKAALALDVFLEYVDIRLQRCCPSLSNEEPQSKKPKLCVLPEVCCGGGRECLYKMISSMGNGRLTG